MRAHIPRVLRAHHWQVCIIAHVCLLSGIRVKTSRGTNLKEQNSVCLREQKPGGFVFSLCHLSHSSHCGPCSICDSQHVHCWNHVQMACKGIIWFLLFWIDILLFTCLYFRILSTICKTNLNFAHWYAFPLNVMSELSRNAFFHFQKKT